MFRPSARQLAYVARLSIRTTASPALRAARISRTVAPGAAAFFPRFNSTKPRRPDDEKKQTNGAPPPQNEQNDALNNSEDPTAGRPPRPQPAGWVFLTPDELKVLRAFIQLTPKGKSDEIMAVFNLVEEIGVPQELKDILSKQRNGQGIGMMDAMRIPKIALKMAKVHHEILEQEREEEQEWDEAPNNKTNFNSNEPGQPGNNNNNNQQQPQQQQQQQEQLQRDGQKGEQTQRKQPGPERSKREPQQQQQQQSQQQKQGQQGQGQGQGKNDPKQDGLRSISMQELFAYAAGTIIFYPILSMMFGESESREITWQELRKNFLDKGLVEKLVVSGDRVRVELNREAVRSVYPDSAAAQPGFFYYFNIGSVDAFERKVDEAQKELGIPSSERIPVSYATEGKAGSYLLAFGPTILLVGLLMFISRKAGGGVGGSSGMFGFGKSKAKMFNHDSLVKVKFADVAGMDEAKVEIMEFVSFLKSPERFQRLGAKIPRGAILSGPPGTGKTLLAKATAGESQVPFFSVSGSEFVEMFVGVGASRVRDLFATARKNAPCIIFIDEIDAVGKSRSDGGGFRGGGNDEREATLNQILTEMDGFNTSEQVVVLAGTNRPDILDKALMRPGRFDRHIHIDRPTMKGRQEIFRVHLKKILTNEDMEYLTGRLAALTPGFAGADIANAVNEAALIAARANAQTVAMTHFEQAIERVIGGLERKSLVLGPEEKRVVAYHEAGHAICGWYFRWADPLLKVSIIPRGQGALGYAQYLPSSDAYLMSTNQLMDRMAMTLGGRISEEIHFPTVTTGASDDFKKVTRMATTMVTQWGMSEKVGPLHYNQEENQLQKPFAESTGQVIDAEVRRIVDDAYKQCKDLLTAKKKEVGMVAEELLRKEVLSRDDLVRLLGPREWPEKEEFSKYFDGTAGKGTPPFPTESTDSPQEPQPAVMEKHNDQPDARR